ncbi:MAG TPA: hypothetical protein EYP04_01420, partial [Anaerolineae bacterium]|nr:hypothetical protein [Anaerolineae bacterium]
MVKLIDFGIARFFKPGKPTDTLKMGTIGYAPPEQFVGKGQTDARSDIYSLGATLHHLLTKRDPTQYPPFSFDTAPPRSLNPAISPHVEAAIMKALAYDRAQRFQSAVEMKRALLPPAPPQSFMQRIMPLLLIAAVVLLVVIALAVTNGWGKFLRPTPTPITVVVSMTPSTPSRGATVVLLPPTETPGSAAPVPFTPTSAISAPTDTPSPRPLTPTATVRPADTPTPEPMAVVAADTLNVRGGPGTDYEIVGKVYHGDQLTIEGRDQADMWLKVAIPDGGSGWVSREYMDTSAAITSIPVIQVTPKPTCRLTVEPQLAAAWDQGKLGCPTSGANITWAAWQPFERGYMFWRHDTMRVVVFYNDGTWTEFADQWDGFTTVSRGNPPPGRVAPIRGFGYLWGIYDDIANRLGWGLEEEKGFCANIQQFEQGFIMHS